MLLNRGARHALPCLAAAAFLTLVCSSLLGSPAANFQAAFTAENREAQTEKTVFSPTVPKIYVIYMLADAEKGDKIKIVWIAEKVEGVDPNSKMGERELPIQQAGSFMGATSYPKPASGWPLGTYRVELSIDGKIDKTLTFKVAK